MNKKLDPGKTVLRLFLLFAVVGTLGVRPAAAQVLPFRSSSAITIGFEERALRSFVSRVELSGLREDGKRISDPAAREMSVTAAPIAVPYAVHRTVVPIVMFPIVHKSLTMNTSTGRDTMTNSGIGDATVMVKVAPLQWDGPNETRRIAFFSGVKFPTGSTGAEDGEGNLFPDALQIGTGAFEFPLGAAFTWQTPMRIGLVADFFYNANTDGDLSTGRDSFKYDAALGWRAYPTEYRTFEERVVNFYFEVNGMHEMNSGDLLYLSPGVQFIARQNLLVETSTQIPVHQSFRGIRPDIDYTFAGGIRWLFPF